MLGAVLAYMLNPGVEWLVKHKLPRPLAVSLVLTVLVLSIVSLVFVIQPLLQHQAGLVQEKFPLFIEKMSHSLIPTLNSYLGTELHIDGASVREFIANKLGQSTQLITNAIVNSIKVGASAIFGWLGLAFLVPIVLFYLLLDWPQLLLSVRSFLPRRWEPKVTRLLDDIDQLLSQFFRGQLLVMLVLALYYSVALAVAGFGSALAIGLLTGLLVFIPYIGFAFGLILALVSAAVEFGSLSGFASVAIIYGLGQVIESFFLTPKLVGKRIGLHPVAVIFALMAFGHLFGFVGVLVALPVSAALLVAFGRARRHYFSSRFYRQ